MGPFSLLKGKDFENYVFQELTTAIDNRGNDPEKSKVKCRSQVDQANQTKQEPQCSYETKGNSRYQL